MLNLDAKELLESQQLRRFYKAFINLDPPYVNKGAQLYKNAFCEADHRTLSELVKQCHRKWIVTYNICPLENLLFYKKGEPPNYEQEVLLLLDRRTC